MQASESLLNDPVGKHARRDYATLRPDWTVDWALARMRESPPPARVVYFYVVNEENKLLGVVPTRRILFAPPDAKIESIMIRNVIAIPEMATVLDACEFFTLHRFLAFPVIGPNRTLVGVIDVEIYTGELTSNSDDETSRHGDDVFEIIGVHLSAAAQANWRRAVRERFPWLLCNVTAGLLAAGLGSVYDDVLTARNAAAALFVPVLLAISESVAMQSVTLAVNRLRGNRRGKNLLAGLREGISGLALGVGTATITAICTGLWLRDFAVTASLFLSICVGVMISAVIGFSVPTCLHKLKLNPQVAAGPLSLACADMVTLAIYFNLARWLICN